ncbi:hypothetical protein ABTX71_29955 [Streptomyces parvulus]|uniref:hypothetical protein n=1 Tax=Streptomyces parvulus TaxID=146923 RepID=UPI0033296FF0
MLALPVTQSEQLASNSLTELLRVCGAAAPRGLRPTADGKVTDIEKGDIPLIRVKRGQDLPYTRIIDGLIGAGSLRPDRVGHQVAEGGTPAVGCTSWSG